MADINQVPEAVDVFMVRGDTLTLPVEITDSAGTAQDITGYTFLITVADEESPATGYTPTFSASGTITDAPNGLVEFEIPAATTATLANARYWYDVQATDPSAKLTTVVLGTINFSPGITL